MKAAVNTSSGVTVRCWLRRAMMCSRIQPAWRIATHFAKRSALLRSQMLDVGEAYAVCFAQIMDGSCREREGRKVGRGEEEAAGVGVESVHYSPLVVAQFTHLANGDVGRVPLHDGK